MKRRALLFAAALAVVLLPVAVDAQTRDNSYEWSAFVGQTLFDSDLDLSDSFYFGTRWGVNFTERYQLELALGFADSRHTRTPLQGDTDVYNLSGMMNFNFPGKTERSWRWVPYVGVGLGTTTYDFQDRKTEQDTTFHVGGGFRWFGTEKIGLRVEAKGISETSGDWANFETTMGLTFVLGGELRDADGDGVPNSKDDCPNTPMGCKVDPRGCELDGDDDGVCDGLDQCPETRVVCKVGATGCDLDGDGDGVCNGADQCPNTPEGCKVTDTGCEIDTDGDGVCDGVDSCSGTRSGCRVDGKGCPKDGDDDGVCDGVDRCTDTPKGCRVNASGCSLDEDSDGVCDGVDECPGTPRGAKVDKVGCELELQISNVQFDFDKSYIKKEFVPILEKVAKALRDNPRMRISLHGHTDSVNSDSYNLRLAQRRCDSVKKWLVEKGGIASDRLETEAHGECCPVADNRTSEGRYKNRRVEFKRIR